MHCRSGSKKSPLHALPHSIGRQLFRMECCCEDLKALGTGNRCNIWNKTEVLEYLGVNIWSFWAAMSPKLIQNGSETNHLKHLGGLGPRLPTMVPKRTIRSIRTPWAQYMYRDWRPSESHTCRGLSVRLGDSLHRAESALHV